MSREKRGLNATSLSDDEDTPIVVSLAGGRSGKRVIKPATPRAAALLPVTAQVINVIPSVPLASAPMAGDDGDDAPLPEREKPALTRLRRASDAPISRTVTIEDVEDEENLGANNAKNPIVVPDSGNDEITQKSNDKSKGKRPADDAGDDSEPKKKKKKKSKKKKAVESQMDPQAVGDDGLLADLGHISDVDAHQDKRSARTQDIAAHFHEARTIKEGGETRQVRDCMICKKYHPHSKHWVVAETSTLRRHMAARHEEAYMRWCRKNDFESKLEKHVKARKATRALQEASLMQTSLDGHLQPRERIVPYSDAEFKRVALEWLAATDQPLSAFEHPRFKEMIDVASRASNGVAIPSRYQTREGILHGFRKYISDLKTRLASPSVKGKVSTTCDAWTADNKCSFFAVTGHWIEETSKGTWALKSALLGFTHIPYAHTGKRLGQAFFKVLQRVSIAHKLGWVTCDNASNNDTMMEELEVLMREDGNFDFSEDNRIRCLAHVINLATQAVITAAAKPFDDAAFGRDVIDLVRNVSIKEHSSSQRRAMFEDIQKAAKITSPTHLKKDMPVRWSSTFLMLERGYELREHVEQFLTEIARAEKSLEKRTALNEAHLTDEEWSRVDLIIQLLSLADNAQQAFSADLYPTLHNSVPAVLGLLRAWQSCKDDDNFAPYAHAITAGIEKLQFYAELMQHSQAEVYFMSMLIHPDIKAGDNFSTIWTEADAELSALPAAERIFKKRFNKLDSSDAPRPQSTAKPAVGVRSLINKLKPSASTAAPPTSEERWRVEYNRFLKAEDELPDNVSLVEWWGMNCERFPTWASLAADYLAAMGSSVSSERAFSSAGITVTKRRNRLKGDIIEALQCFKSALRNDLFLRQSGPSSVLEDILDAEEQGEASFGTETAPEALKLLQHLENLSLGISDEAEEDDAPDAL